MSVNRDNLLRALEALTLQLKRYNDRNEPTRRVAGEAELFRANSEEEVAARELHESLRDLQTLQDRAPSARGFERPPRPDKRRR